MSHFKMEFFADAKGLMYFNLCLQALHNERCKKLYDYEVEYNLDCDEHRSGKKHVIKWWYKKGVQR